MFTKEQTFGTRSSENDNIKKFIQESLIHNPKSNLRWIPYDNFLDTKRIADSKYYTFHSATASLRNYIINKRDCEIESCGVVLKELKDYRYDILEFIKAIKEVIDNFDTYYPTKYKSIGISKNPSTQNYIIAMRSCEVTIHSCLSESGFVLKIGWISKTDWLHQIIEGLDALHENNLIKEVIDNFDTYYPTKYKSIGISKNPSTQNYIIAMRSCEVTIHSCLSESGFVLKIGWISKTDWLHQIIEGLDALHENNLVHCDLHSRNISMKEREDDPDLADVIIGPGLCKLSNNLALNFDNKYNNVYGSIPYIPPEVLRGNEFTKKGDIYSFGGIMYEMATGNQPFSHQAHDTYLIIDICNGVRPKVPDMMLNLIPKCYLDMMYRCWDDDPSKRPTAHELNDILYLWKIDSPNDENFYEAYLNRKRINKSHKQKLFRSLYNFHPQSCYISRDIHTLYELQDSLEDIKSGKCADPNLCLKHKSDILT
ncbi:hypothetical protein Glove_109g205 [Diversispora epigaea]|uniref:non-specific serine/threonine protein kinase n=1 Tax=Diversispora epigaea TaxID=1348612 RepID=A0A397J2H7_9GLOM|nr:hypothetical protein Glove_109g205 [Diversispora epigaea]